jgi:hypothetical protein
MGWIRYLYGDAVKADIERIRTLHKVIPSVALRLLLQPVNLDHLDPWCPVEEPMVRIVRSVEDRGNSRSVVDQKELLLAVQKYKKRSRSSPIRGKDLTP